MSKFLWALSLVGFILVGACSTTKWNKPGATQVEFAQDRDLCIREATASEVRQGEFGGTRRVKSVDREHFRTCMQSRGWEPQT